MFSDTATHWASGCIVALAQRQIVKGYPNGRFRPETKLHRAEFAALLLRAFPQLPEKLPAGRATPQKATAFCDIFPTHWASDAIRWVSDRNLIQGYRDGTFRPRQVVSRAQAMVTLVAALDAAQGVDVDLSVSVDETADTFSDADEIPAYAREAIAAALSCQLLEPLSDHLCEPRPLKPQQAITRAEAAALVCRALAIPVEVIAPMALVAAQNQQALFHNFLQQETGFHAERLAFLDRGIARSPYRKDIARAGLRLQTPDGIPALLTNTTAYPQLGQLLFVDEGGLTFLSPDILSGCVCLATIQKGQLVTRWLGRSALVERQLWSATKFIPLLSAIACANALSPTTDIDRCWVRQTGSGTQQSYRFGVLAAEVMNYSDRIATSNALAAMFKQFESPDRLEKWTQKITGNSQLSFQGRYGEAPFIPQPELCHPQTKQVLLKPAERSHQGQNLLSTYDLTRLLSILGWHWQLPADAAIPHLQGHGALSLIRAMGVDTARYVDVALETLGLRQWVKSPVIISKCGFGRSEQRDRTELTYCAFVQFSLPRHLCDLQCDRRGKRRSPEPTAAYQRYSLCFTLMAAQNASDADQEARYVDALMAASVTEIMRRLVVGTFAEHPSETPLAALSSL